MRSPKKDIDCYGILKDSFHINIEKYDEHLLNLFFSYNHIFPSKSTLCDDHEI